MSLLTVTQTYDVTSDLTLPTVVGKASRVTNVGTGDITVTLTGGSPYTLPVGKTVEFWYDNSTWKKNTVSVDSPTDTAILNYLFPVGSVYAQFPAAKSNTESVAFPVADRPATKFGGSWTEIFNTSTDDAFFKVGTTDHRTRVDGLSPDQMQRLTGTFYTRTRDSTEALSIWGCTGVFKPESKTSESVVGFTGSNGSAFEYIQFDSNGSLNARTSSTTSGVTEPRNYRMKIWKRTA